ncbi:MAG: sensor histidine kinase [Carbonactinosporaceae bacterium]
MSVHGTGNEQLDRTHSAPQAAEAQQLVATERDRIARELHDSVAQQVLSIGMHVEWCRRRVANLGDSALDQQLEATKEMARATAGHIREAIFDLSLAGTSQSDGLITALQRLIADGPALGPAITLRVSGSPKPVPADVEQNLYGIAREALFNVAHHARATRTWVCLTYRERGVRLTVTDNGVGDADLLRRLLSREATARGGCQHYGLHNMARRAHLVGGRLTISPPPSRGVRVTAIAPAGAG